MSSFSKNITKSYTELLDIYLDYSFVALSSSAVIVYKNFRSTQYVRTTDMLKREILEELDKNYSSPERAITRRTRRFMFA